MSSGGKACRGLWCNRRERARASEARRRSFAVKPPLPLHHIPKTSFNVSLTSDRTFAMTKLPLEDLKSIRRTAGTTLNDVYLCVCAGALRRYLLDRGELPARPLVASVPVSTDPNVARMSGNRVDNLYVSIGTDIADPVRRLEHIRSMTAASKEVRSVLGHELFAAARRLCAATDLPFGRAALDSVPYCGPGPPTPQRGALQRRRTQGADLLRSH